MRSLITTFLFISLCQLSLGQAIKNIVVFGDSYSDTGNHQKLTNGPLWSQNLATSWDASLYSFAFSGAVCSNRMYSTKQFIPSIEDQIEMYYNQSLQLNPEETITIFWVGVNDIYHIYEQDDDDKGSKLKKVVDCISTNIRTVRRIFSTNRYIVFGIPPLEKMPYFTDKPDKEIKENAANMLNEYLSNEVQKLNKHIEHLKLDFMDIHRLLDDIVAQPDSFELKNAVDPYWDVCQGQCMDDVNSYVWWDKVHLTGGVHRLIAESILQSSNEGAHLPEIEQVNKMIEQTKYRSPQYQPKAQTGLMQKLIEKMQKEKETTKEQEKELEQDVQENSSNLSYYVYFGISATVIVCIGFILFNKKSSNRASQLASLSNLLKKDDRGRFVPLRNMDSDV
ncbi:hypothetical protein G6F68_003323 [Rhizopus microsporus]|nr:hypothetical protein G6F67_003119 [Rhizopus microsporus]KAG1265745.1 hypothetical protein G6F68_003323 [Rhizopus microsporus]